MSVCVSEIALQQVSMFFRSDLKWEVLEPLKDIGKTLNLRLRIGNMRTVRMQLEMGFDF